MFLDFAVSDCMICNFYRCFDSLLFLKRKVQLNWIGNFVTENPEFDYFFQVYDFTPT